MSLAGEFIQSPTYELLSRCTKDNLLQIAENYTIELTSEYKTEERNFVLKKLELELSTRKDAIVPAVVSVPPVSLLPPGSVSPPHVSPVDQTSSDPGDYGFDVSRNISLVPPFNEREVEKYFSHFERVAITLKWPTAVWSLSLQCVLSGKAQEVYSALTVEQSSDYSTVKTAILNAYELVPEAYNQKFSRLSKNDRITYVEFAHEKENLFDRWCTSEHVTSREQLRELVLLEEFKNCVPDAVATYQHDRQVTMLAQLLEPFQSQRMALLCETFL
uniref:SCAN box domain-containing protein n=1 Tax=Denticeps clupeoides TaxID=299321 RepID=A0AAY4DAZ5_9TELE